MPPAAKDGAVVPPWQSGAAPAIPAYVVMHPPTLTGPPAFPANPMMHLWTMSQLAALDHHALCQLYLRLQAHCGVAANVENIPPGAAAAGMSMTQLAAMQEHAPLPGGPAAAGDDTMSQASETVNRLPGMAGSAAGDSPRSSDPSDTAPVVDAPGVHHVAADVFDALQLSLIPN